jgi:hypothetical protein
MYTNPPFHASMIATADRTKGGKLLPIIRLMKAWNIVNGHHLSSFHLEMLVEVAQRPYQIFGPAFEVWWTMGVVARLLEYKFSDPWPLGGRIDAYLSDEERIQAIRMMKQGEERAGQAREYEKLGKIPEAFERWNVVYNGTFPTYG